jgi:hypothetical protein
VAAKARGEESPSESESTGVDSEDEGGLFPDPTFHPPKTFPRLVTSSPNRRGSPFLLNGQNITGQMPGDGPAHRRSTASRWYAMS